MKTPIPGPLQTPNPGPSPIGYGGREQKYVEFAGLCGMYGWERDRDRESQRPGDPKSLDRYCLRREAARMEITRANVENWDTEMMVKILKRGYVEADPRYGNATEMNRPVMPKLVPSAELAAIVGPKPLRMSDATVKVWEYIKAKDLLVDGAQGRYIQCDQTLAAIMLKGGCEEHESSLRQLSAALKRHLTKVDKTK